MSTKTMRLLTGAAVIALLASAETARAQGSSPDKAAPPASASPVAADSGADVVQEVVVTGSRQTDPSGYANASKNSGQTYKLTATQTETRITQRELLEASIPVGSISETVGNQPNVFAPTTTSPIVGGNIYIRGFSKGFLNITLDGIPINLTANQTVYSNQILPLGLTGAIDLKPGAGSATTVGDSDFGGSVDVISANPSPSPFGTLEGGYGSFGETKYGLTLNTGTILNGTTSIIANINHQSADGYFTKGADGTRTESGRVPDYEQGAVKLVSNIGPGVLTGLVSRTDEKFDVITGATVGEIAQYGPQATAYTGPSTTTSNWLNNYKKEDNLITYLDYTFPVGGLATISERPYYWNGYTYQSSVPTAAPYSSHYIEQALFRDFRYGDILKADIDATSWLKIQTGVYLDAEHFVATQPLSALLPGFAALPEALHQVVETHTVQPYLSVTIAATDRFTITPGVKYSDVSRSFQDSIANAGYHETWTDWLPSLGLNYVVLGTRAAPTLSVYGNYTRSFEPPSYSQISTSAQNFGLMPQLADSYEVGSMWNAAFWSGQLAAFETHFLNYVQSETISNAAHPNGFTAFANAGGAVYQGVGFSNSFNVTRKIALLANLGYLDAHFTSQSTPITYAPHGTGSLGLRYQGDAIQFGATIDYNSGYFVNNGGTIYTRLKSYVVANLFADYRLPIVMPHTESTVISLNINDALNRHYIVDGTSFAGKPTFEYALPLNAFVDLKVRFN